MAKSVWNVEFEAWDRAGAHALHLVERLARGGSGRNR